VARPPNRDKVCPSQDHSSDRPHARLAKMLEMRIFSHPSRILVYERYSLFGRPATRQNAFAVSENGRPPFAQGFDMSGAMFGENVTGEMIAQDSSVISSSIRNGSVHCR